MTHTAYRTVSYHTDVFKPPAIPLANYVIQKPVFFGGAKKDYVASSAGGKAAVTQFCKGDLAIHEFDAAHWLIWEAKDELNDKLVAWVEGLGLEYLHRDHTTGM